MKDICVLQPLFNMETVSRAPEALGENNLCKSPLFVISVVLAPSPIGDSSGFPNMDVDRTHRWHCSFLIETISFKAACLPAPRTGTTKSMLALDSPIGVLRTVDFITIHPSRTAKTFSMMTFDNLHILGMTDLGLQLFD
jgi:hypothetical protein